MRFDTTSVYENDIKRLSKKLPNLKKDICAEFKGKTIDEILAKKYLLQDAGNYKTIKVRIANSQQNKGKSNGFRLIILVDRISETVTFLKLYSKVSVDAKENVSKKEVREFLKIFKKERVSKKLNLIEIDSYS